MSMKPSLAVLGLGVLGRAIALRLHEQGFAVTGWNRTPDKAAPLAAAGLTVAPDVNSALATAEIVLLTLSDAAAISATLFGTVPVTCAGRLVVQMGTIAPEESLTLAAQVTAAGGEYLEAPVLGSVPEARSGTLLIMAGGTESAFTRAEPVFAALSAQPQLIGPLGQGAALKLAMNQLIAGLTASFCYSLGWVQARGIDVALFMHLLRASALYAPTFDKKLAKYLARDYGQANFPLAHLLKDLRLFRQAVTPLGMDPAPLQALEDALVRASAAGWHSADYAALYESLVGATPVRPSS